MIKQFEINPYVGRQLRRYLDDAATDLAAAMDDETRNGEIAAILHAGFPLMVRKIYPFAKFQTFFWEKRALLATHIQNRLDAFDKAAQKSR